MKKYFLLIIAAALFAGCRSQYVPSVNTTGPAMPTANVRKMQDERIITDPVLANTVYLQEVRLSSTNDGHRKVQVMMKNFAKVSIGIKYRFTWYDAEGIENTAVDHDLWEETVIPPGDDQNLLSTAPSTTSSDFKLRIIAR